MNTTTRYKKGLFWTLLAVAIFIYLKAVIPVEYLPDWMTPAAYRTEASSLTASTDEQLHQIKQVFSPELLPKPTQE
jgi:hypothetical protein